MSGGFRSRAKGRREENPAPAPARAGAERRRQSAAPARIGDGAREAAYEVVRRVDTDDAFANLVLPKLLGERAITGRDAAFATELAYGTLRAQGVLDAVIAKCSSRELDKIAPEVLAALRLGAYQLLYMRVDDHAAVDTSVRLVEAAGAVKAKGFANAVLRTIARTPAHEWMEQLAPDEPVAEVAFATAHPEWIARSFRAALAANAAADGADGELRAALEADSERPVVHLVARPGEISAAELAAITGGDEGTYSPYAVYLPEGDPGALEPVRDGIAGVQDEGSQLIARAAAEVPVEDDGGRWLDLCAGPGGKAALLGSLAGIEGARVDAIEISDHRAELIRKAVKGLPVTVTVADGRDPGLEPGFDRVLVDAPCSGLGALRRRPEARWKKQESEIAQLTVLQRELLESAIRLAKPGGAVVYSTCSPDVRETRGVVDAVLAGGEVDELDARQFVPGMEGTGDAKSVQMWPHRHGTDAMFFAVLRKK
ncbi:16S rRNA (cytosine967-C5)-methyltransferase [Corynebacterium mycetoides]|uniref:16S rRNA (Cytosine967-C5)-methyltransferase n=1 Tax=Corynebacterium mycetoides TaxID=38302 RepID=A0A1G9MIX2_9CORY|nr:transcription antitermination factor NusB [Corynebacterium mycetoides]SDL73605.1 16S rRNA (cytosine967-C5)-methyltransferase [Corynebacterium mycetoides]